MDVVEDLTGLGRASSLAASGRRSLLGYDWKLGERDSGLPEGEAARRSSPPTRNCKDGRRSPSRRRDRDGDRDGHGGQSRGSRRAKTKERGSGRSGRSEPYPVGRVSERSRYDGRRCARARRPQAVKAVAIRRREVCSPEPARQSSPPPPEAGATTAIGSDGEEEDGGVASLLVLSEQQNKEQEGPPERAAGPIEEGSEEEEDVVLPLLLEGPTSVLRPATEEFQQADEALCGVRAALLARGDGQEDDAESDDGDGLVAPCPLANFIAKITARIEDTVLGEQEARPSIRRSVRLAKVLKPGRRWRVRLWRGGWVRCHRRWGSRSSSDAED